MHPEQSGGKWPACGNTWERVKRNEERRAKTASMHICLLLAMGGGGKMQSD